MPLETIAKAVELAISENKQNHGVKLLLGAAVYREPLVLEAASGQTDAPIVVESREPGQAVIAGSDVWSYWFPDQLGTTYMHDWPYAWGEAAIPAGWEAVAPDLKKNPVLLRREMVFVDGDLLTQVIDKASLVTGSFHVSEADKKITIWPKEPLTADSLVEVAARGEILIVKGRKNVALRGLVFRHGNPALDQPSAIIDGSSHVLVDGCAFVWNNAVGLAITSSEHVVVRGSAGNHNGSGAWGTWQARDLLFENAESSYNNWRGAWGGFYSWAAGQNFRLLHRARFCGYRSLGNQTRGIWLGTDVSDVEIIDSTFADNLTDGIFLEAIQGPLAIRSSKICGNKASGILDGKADNVTVAGTTIARNGADQINFGGQEGGRAFTPFDARTSLLIRSQHWTLAGNTIVGAAPSGLDLGTTLSQADWNALASTFASAKNAWFNKDLAAFRVVGGNILDFSGWQAYAGQDADSTFASSGAPECIP